MPTRIQDSALFTGSLRLCATVTPEFCWWMGVDLLVRFVLSGLVIIVSPNTHVQLWFGSVASLVAVQLQAQLQPYQDWLLNAVQQTLNLQLLLTYLTSHVFFRQSLGQSSGTQPQNDLDGIGFGLALVAVNCIALCLIVASSAKGSKAIQMVRTSMLRADGIALMSVWEGGAGTERGQERRTIQAASPEHLRPHQHRGGPRRGVISAAM